MDKIELRAETRNVFGKKTKRLRAAGFVPAVLYGPKTEPISLQVPERELSRILHRAGMNQLIALWIDEADQARMTLAREVQRDVITQSLLHVDLYEVVMTESITAETPIVLVGQSPAVESKAGLLVRGVDTVQVHGLPAELPESIEVDISVLNEADQAILVGDLTVDGTIEILTHPEEVVVQVLPVKEMIIEEVVEEVEVEELEAIAAAEELAEVVEEEQPPIEEEQPQAESE